MSKLSVTHKRSALVKLTAEELGTVISALLCLAAYTEPDEYSDEALDGLRKRLEFAREALK